MDKQAQKQRAEALNRLHSALGSEALDGGAALASPEAKEGLAALLLQSLDNADSEGGQKEQDIAALKKILGL